MSDIRRVAVLLFCGLTIMPAAAGAQSPLTPGGWIVTPAIGIAFDPDGDVSLTLSGAAGHRIAGPWGVEGELGHVFDTEPDTRDVDSSLTTVHGTLLYFIETSYALTPYLAAGLGVGHFSHEESTPDDSFESTEVGFNLGGGVTHPLDDRLWIRGDFRFFKHIDEIPSAWRLSAAVVLNLSN